MPTVMRIGGLRVVTTGEGFMARRDELEEATERGAARRKRGPTALAAQYDRRTGRVLVRLSTGLDLGFAPRDVQGLEKARPADLASIEISPSGLGLHFPSLDADLYLPALLEGFRGSKKWMAAWVDRGQGRGTHIEAKSRSSRASASAGRVRKSGSARR